MIRFLSFLYVGALALVAVSVTGCGEKTKPVQATGGKAEGGEEGDATPIDSTDLLGDGASLIDATFKIDVTSLFGIQVCKGEVDFKFNAGIGKQASAAMFEIPKGIVDCGLVGKINLAEVLGAFSTQQQQAQEPVVIKNNLINLKQIGSGSFNPARPLMPNFIATKKEKLAELDHTEAVTVTSLKDGKKSSGNVTVRTLGMNQSYTPASMQREFSKVLHFEVLNKGFNGADKFATLLFDRMEFKISLDPVAVLYIEFKGKISDAMAAAGGAGGGGALGGLTSGPLIGLLTKIIDVNIKMDLVKMKGLKESPGQDTSDLGEEIGGKSTKNEDE